MQDFIPDSVCYWTNLSNELMKNYSSLDVLGVGVITDDTVTLFCNFFLIRSIANYPGLDQVIGVIVEHI